MRHTINTKKNKFSPPKDLSFIILAAGSGHKMRSYGPKSLIMLKNSECLIDRQIRIIRGYYPSSEIITVTGFEHEKMQKKLYGRVKIVENEKYDETGSTRSFAIGSLVTDSKNVIVVMGDLVFSDDIFNGFDFSESYAPISKSMDKKEVGINFSDGLIGSFSYGLENMWGQLIYLSGETLETCKKFATIRKNSDMLFFETLNFAIENKHKIRTSVVNNFIYDIDSPGDLGIVNANINS